VGADRVRDAAESLHIGGGGDEEGEDAPLFVEFTGLLTWHAGANLGWHDDASGGPHLAQARATRKQMHA
jgi:hypothetical protein